MKWRQDAEKTTLAGQTPSNDYGRRVANGSSVLPFTDGELEGGLDPLGAWSARLTQEQQDRAVRMAGAVRLLCSPRMR